MRLNSWIILLTTLEMLVAAGAAEGTVLQFSATVEIVVPPNTTIPGLPDGRAGTLTYEYDSDLVDSFTTGLTGNARGDYGPLNAAIDFGSGDSLSVSNATLQILNAGSFFAADTFFLSMVVDNASIKSGLFAAAANNSGVSWRLRGDGSNTTSITSDDLPTATPNLSEFPDNTISINFLPLGAATGTVTSVHVVDPSAPEPTSLILLGLAAASFGAVRHRYRSPGTASLKELWCQVPLVCD
jgi:hypothetical protein